MKRRDLCVLALVLAAIHPGADPKASRLAATSPRELAAAPEAPHAEPAPAAPTGQAAAEPLPAPPAPVVEPAAAPSPGVAALARVLRRSNEELSHGQASEIGAAILRHCGRRGLDADLVLAVILVESGARPSVVSPQGALGLMQVMPAHFEKLAPEVDPTHIDSNVRVGCGILARNIARHGEDRGILAYYWGDDIRGDEYLEKIRAVQARVRTRLSS